MSNNVEKLGEVVGGWPFWGDEYICVRYGDQIQGINFNEQDGYEIVRARVKDCTLAWSDWEPDGVVQVRRITPDDAERWCSMALSVGYAPRVIVINKQEKAE